MTSGQEQQDLKGMAALALWHDVLAGGLRAGGPDLTTRQLAILLHVYVRPPPHTVRGLATAFELAKPAVTRALDRLCALELLRRKKDEADKRSILVQRTVRGAVYMTEFADRIAAARHNGESNDHA